MAREYFLAYHSYLSAIEPLDDAERGRLFTALLTYSSTGQAPVLTGNERFLFPMMKNEIDRSLASYNETCEKRRASGRLGGRPPKAEDAFDSKANGFPENQKKQMIFSETKKSQREGESECKRESECEGEGEQGHSACARECDPEIEKAVDYYAQHIDSSFGRRVGEELVEYTSKYGSAMMIYAIDSAMAAGKRTWAYIRGILRRWDKQGVKTLADVQRLDAEHDAEMQHKASPGGSSQHTAAQSNRKPSVRDVTRSDAEREAAGDWLKHAANGHNRLHKSATVTQS